MQQELRYLWTSNVTKNLRTELTFYYKTFERHLQWSLRNLGKMKILVEHLALRSGGIHSKCYKSWWIEMFEKPGFSLLGNVWTSGEKSNLSILVLIFSICIWYWCCDISAVLILVPNDSICLICLYHLWPPI